MMRNDADDVISEDRLATYVPTRTIQPFAGLPDVHFIADSSLGYGWQMGVPALEAVDDGEAFVADAYDQLLRQLPAGHSIDLYISRGRDVGAYLRSYAQSAGENEFASAMCHHKMQRWWLAQESGFFPQDPSINFFPRSQSIFLFYKTSPQKELLNNSARSMLAWLWNGAEKRIEQDLREVGAEFRRRVHQIEQTAASAHLHLRRLTADDFVQFAGSLFFPQSKSTHTPSMRLSDDAAEAIGMMGEVSSIQDDCILTDVRGETVCHRAVSMTWPPKVVMPGMFASLVDMETDITVCLSYEAQSRIETMWKLKSAKHLNRKMATPFTEVETDEKESSFRDAESRMFSGENFGGTRFMVWVRGRDEEDAMDRATRVVGHLDTQMPADIENLIGSSVLMRSLPMGRHPAVDRSLARSRRLLSNDAATIAPIGGYWEGTAADESMVMYPSRWGTPLFVDPRVCDTNPHFLVVGGSGSGKTFWVHDLLLQLLRLPEVWVCLISIKPDYERLARLVGKYIEIDLDGGYSINPFGGEPTNDNLSIWVAVLVNMLTESDDRIIIDKEAQGLLSEQALLAAQMNWDARGNRPMRETLLQHIVERLNRSELGRQVAERLQPYHSGAYAKLFNRPRSLEASDRFVFFNLSKVVDYSCASVASLCVFNFVNSVMYDPAKLGVLKLLGLDEGWALMKDEGSAALAQKGFRSYRSLGGLAFAISQLMSDFDTPLGRAILANTPTKIILKQQQSAIKTLTQYLSLQQKEMELVQSLQLRKRQYGEFFVKMEGRPSTVGRVIPDAFSYAISTTDANDNALYQRILMECSGDSIAATNRFADEFPYGKRKM